MTHIEIKKSIGNKLPRFECTKCGSCCREQSMLITVTGRDIVRLSIALGLNTESMLRALDFYIIEEQNEIPIGLQGIPSPHTERGPAFIALKKMENGDCIFLRDNLCMIHAIRPAVCMSFPFVFQETSDGMKWGLSAVKHICPGLDIGPRVSDEEIWELSLSVLQNMKAYAEFVDEWNAKSAGTAIDFIRAILSEPRFLT